MEHRSHRNDGDQALDESRQHRTWTTAKHTTNLEKLKLGNMKRCSGRSTHQGATRKLNSQTSRVEEVCLENACMHDVHITGPLPPTQHNHKGLALCSRCHLAWASEGTPVGPGKDTHGTLGPEQRSGRGWPTPTPKGRSAHAMTRTQDSPTHKSSDKHGSGAGDHQLQVTITNRRRRLSRYRTTSSSIRYQ